MKVLMVGLATFEEMAGGSARYLSGLRDALTAAGHEVHVRTASSVVGSPGYVEAGFWGQTRRALARFLIHAPRCAWAVVRLRPDVVNSHYSLDGAAAVAIARVLRRRVVVNFQGPWAREALSTGRRGRWPLSTWLRHALEGWVYRRAAACIVLSRGFGEMLVTDYGVRPERIRVIPPGFDPGCYRLDVTPSEARRRLGLPDVPTALSVRRLVPRMGLDLAIRAVAQVPPDLVARYVIAGTGPERQPLEELAAELGVADRLSFPGRVPDADLPLLYKAADLSIVPTRELEGFGYVALESLAAGTPVIATRTGGLVDLLEGLEPRWLTAAEPEALAEAIRGLAQGRSGAPDREACSAYARQFDWRHIAPRVTAVLAGKEERS
jgi:glycosyltransferase involved in cell wall biosynthesis